MTKGPIHRRTPSGIAAQRRPTLPLGVTLALITCVLFSLIATAADWFWGRQPRIDPHNVALYEALAASIKDVRPGLTSIGYITNSVPEHFYKLQYALAPVLLVPGTTEKTVLGYFPSTQPDAAVALARTHGLHVVTTLRKDVYILAH